MHQSKDEEKLHMVIAFWITFGNIFVDNFIMIETWTLYNQSCYKLSNLCENVRDLGVTVYKQQILFVESLIFIVNFYVVWRTKSQECFNKIYMIMDK